MRSEIVLGLLVTAAIAGACGETPGRDGTPDDTPVTAEKPFAAGGHVDMDLGAGAYEVRPSADARVHVATSGHTGSAKVDVTTEGNTATIKIVDTPRNNFHAAIDVPKQSDVVVHLSAGELTVGSLAGNLDVDSAAGNVRIEVDAAKNYGTVDASVKAGDIVSGPFGDSKSGLLPHLTWSGAGKRTIHVTMGAGKLTFEE